MGDDIRRRVRLDVPLDRLDTNLMPIPRCDFSQSRYVFYTALDRRTLDRRTIADQAVNLSRILSIIFLAGIHFCTAERLMHIAMQEGRLTCGFTNKVLLFCVISFT